MTVKAIPEGFHTITPYFFVHDADQFINFLKKAFHAEETHRSATPDGKVMHAQVKIGTSYVMISDSRDSPFKPMPGMFYMYVNDTDAMYDSALKAGATSIMPPADQFYGDRKAAVQDDFGNQWWIATHQEDVSATELEKRARQCFSAKK